MEATLCLCLPLTVFYKLRTYDKQNIHYLSDCNHAYDYNR